MNWLEVDVPRRGQGAVAGRDEEEDWAQADWAQKAANEMDDGECNDSLVDLPDTDPACRRPLSLDRRDSVGARRLSADGGGGAIRSTRRYARLSTSRLPTTMCDDSFPITCPSGTAATPE